jgi:hypothetical protein
MFSRTPGQGLLTSLAQHLERGVIKEGGRREGEGVPSRGGVDDSSQDLGIHPEPLALRSTNEETDNEAQSIRKTYEQIVKRLKEEWIGFDNQLQAIERTLQTKQKDDDELLLSGDANHAKEVADGEFIEWQMCHLTCLDGCGSVCY